MRVDLSTAFKKDRISIGEEIILQLSMIDNPGSTRPSSPYALEILTDQYQIVAEQRTEGSRVQLETPAEITSFSFDALDLS